MNREQKQGAPDNRQDILDWALKTLHAMLYGGKPDIDPRHPEQSWLLKQMTRMHHAGFLCEEPESYLTLPEDDPALARYKGVTLREPLPKQLTTEIRYLEKIAHEPRYDVRNFKVLGADDSCRYRRDCLDQESDADAFILTKGGIMELYQFLIFAKARLEGMQDRQDKLLIVQNDDGFWTPTLEALSSLPEAAEIRITDTRHDTVETMEQNLGPRRNTPPVQSDGVQTIPPGATIFLVTGNRKKVCEYKKVLAQNGTDARIVWFQQEFDKPRGADELSFSYMGNLLEKLENSYRHIRDHYGPQGFRTALKDKGYDIGKAVLWFDDSGLELSGSLTSGPEFENCAYRTNPCKKNGPGAEMKNVVAAMQNHPFENQRGIRAFVARVRATLERLQDEQEPAADGISPAIPIRAIDRCCVAIVPLKSLVDAIESGASFQDVLNRIPMHFFQAATENRLILTPQPDTPAVDTKNFLVPLKDPEERTMAENPHYVALHGITAQVVKTATRTLGLKSGNRANTLSQTFTGPAGQNWTLATQQSLRAGFRGQNALAAELAGLYRLLPGNGGRFDPANTLDNFHDLTRRADGFLLTTEFRREREPEHFWHRAFMFFSLIVGRQINDKTVTAKPLVVMDGPTWRPFINLLEIYGGGLIPEMPHEILDAVVPEGQNPRQSLDRAFSEYRPDEPPGYEFTNDGTPCPPDLFRITIYCSATTTDYPMKMWTRDFAFDCGALGFAVRNGGGTGPDGLMIETSEAFRHIRGPFDAFLKKRGLPGAPPTHIASIQCIDTAQEEGLCKFNDYWAVHPTIYHRMLALQDTDAEVVLPGGAGTIQEIAASVLMRRAGLFPVQNRPLVIVNHEGIFDPFLKLIPPQDKDLYNIRIVETAAEALDILIDARSARGMDPALPYRLCDYAALKREFTTGRRAASPAPARSCAMT